MADFHHQHRQNTGLSTGERCRAKGFGGYIVKQIEKLIGSQREIGKARQTDIHTDRKRQTETQRHTSRTRLTASGIDLERQTCLERLTGG